MNEPKASGAAEAAREAGRLSAPNYWNSLYVDGEGGPTLPEEASSTLRRVLTPLVGRRHAAALAGGGYARAVMNEILQRHLPHDASWKMLEVGSAPGLILVRFHRRFGYDPYGIEYTPAGVEVNRQVFSHYGLDPEHVIHADFFSEEFLATHRERFDVVFSVGFVEHFADPKGVVERHLALLRDGGRLIIEIPNLRGINAWLTRFFHPESLAIHNLGLMNAKSFAALFQGLPLRPLHCGYVGFFSFSLQNTRPGSRKRHALQVGRRLAQIVDIGLLAVLRRWRPELPWTSPYLLYVGEKRA